MLKIQSEPKQVIKFQAATPGAKLPLKVIAKQTERVKSSEICKTLNKDKSAEWKLQNLKTW